MPGVNVAFHISGSNYSLLQMYLQILLQKMLHFPAVSMQFTALWCSFYKESINVESLSITSIFQIGSSILGLRRKYFKKTFFSLIKKNQPLQQTGDLFRANPAFTQQKLRWLLPPYDLKRDLAGSKDGWMGFFLFLSKWLGMRFWSTLCTILQHCYLHLQKVKQTPSISLCGERTR